MASSMCPKYKNYKHMKRLLSVFTLMFIVFACTKDFEELNIDDKRATEVPAGFLFSMAQKALADQYASTSRDQNNWKLFAQYWTQTTYIDESNYDVVVRDVGSNMFDTYYRAVLANLNEASRLTELEEALDEEAMRVKQNKLHVIALLEVYTWQQLVDIFGDVPYTEALDIENITPVYDDAFTIYEDLLARASHAVEGLEEDYDAFSSHDLMMDGNVSLWKQFGHTLIVRMAINLVEVDEQMARAYIEASFDSGFDYGVHCAFAYPGAGNANPLYLALVQSGRRDFLPANTIVDLMNLREDPRRPKYFEINGETYRGGIYGASNPYFQFSHISDRLHQPDYASVMLDYTGMAFYLAEAAERGFDVGKSASEWYELGIRSSMDYWGVGQEKVEAYLQRPTVAYDNHGGAWKQRIGEQLWLAMYVRGLEGWTTYRRLGHPELNLPPSPAESADSAVPRRHTYPISEQTLNAENYQQASEKIGGDWLSTPLFWDIHAK